jgi:hypothetical protein
VIPPAEYGTMTLMQRCGYCPAVTCKEAGPSSPATTTTRRWRRLIFMTPPFPVWASAMYPKPPNRQNSGRATLSRVPWSAMLGAALSITCGVCIPVPDLWAAMSHCMTSSARRSTDCGMLTPRRFAVFKFTTSSYLADTSMGRSPGFSPRKTRSAYSAAR